MEEHSDGPRLSVAAVAHRLGVAPATLRTWDRRYGLGPSEHAAGAHRRYSEADLHRLRTMRRLTLDGVPPAEAARVALGQPLLGPAERQGKDRADLPTVDGSLRPPPGGGGRVLALPGADGVVRGLGRAAMALDAHAVTALVREQVARHGVLQTWDHVLRPVLVAAGARWAATGEGIEVEHLLSDCIAAALRETAAAVPDHPTRRPVLLACAPDEWHVLPLSALAAGLAERGVATRMLGAATPPSALRAAVRRTGPAVLFLWSQLRSTADPGVLDDLPVTRPPTSLVVGGGGWVGAALPARVTLAHDLPHALDLVSAAVGAPSQE